MESLETLSVTEPPAESWQKVIWKEGLGQNFNISTSFWFEVEKLIRHVGSSEITASNRKKTSPDIWEYITTRNKIK